MLKNRLIQIQKIEDSAGRIESRVNNWLEENSNFEIKSIQFCMHPKLYDWHCVYITYEKESNDQEDAHSSD